MQREQTVVSDSCDKSKSLLKPGSKRFLKDSAQIISTICNPFLTALALFAILSWISAGDTSAFWRLLSVTAAFTAVGPMVFVLWCYATDRISDLDMSVRSERESFILAFVGFYCCGTIALALIHAPALIVATMAGYTANTVIVGIITRYWKISTHALGITAPLVTLTALYGSAPVPFMILIPLVGWARVYLHAHTAAQVFAGIGLALVSVLFFLRLFHLV